jgi:sugar transferase (PEP-CTERM/EpsH1 system associated)
MNGDARPLIVHVVHRFAVGGLENGLVNLINRMSSDRWRHAVLALDSVSDEMKARVRQADVQYVVLAKPPGHLYRLYPVITRMMRALAPAIVHTRNLGPLEAVVPAFLAGVPVRVHGEHGWDVNDVEGTNRRYQLVRRAYRPFVHRYVALSGQIERYLQGRIGVPAKRITTICNGVDAVKFRPRATGSDDMATEIAQRFPGALIVGTVGRLQSVKNQVLLVRAFARAVAVDGDTHRRMRLVIVGDGATRPSIENEIAAAGLGEHVWLPGERADVAQLMRSFDLFCLPSLSEGISNTILEAMASGLPVVASNVGGNAELVDDGRTGHLFPSGSVEALSELLLAYSRDPAMGQRHGAAARDCVERRFSLDAMVNAYEQMYLAQLEVRGAMGARFGAA